MPCLIGRNGVEKQFGVALNERETAKLNASIDYIQLAMKDAKTGPFKQ
jgi:L-lactate dehydrogenase